MSEPPKTKRALEDEPESLKQRIRESEQAESERKRAAEALRESGEFFKAIIQNASDIILVVDKLGAITYASPSIERFLGYGPDELIGKSSLDLIMSEDKPRAMQDFGRALQTREVALPNVFRIKHKNGAERTLEGLGKNLLDNPIVAGFVMNIRDITEQKRARDETAILAEIGRIIGSSLEIDEVYERFAAEAKKLIPFDRLALNVVHPHADTFNIAYTFGSGVPLRMPGDAVPQAGTLAEEALRTRTSLILQPEGTPESIAEIVSRLPGLSPNFQAGLLSFLSVPLIYRDEAVGVLHFRSKKTRVYTEQDRRLAERIGDQIAGAIANAQLFADLKKVEEEERRNREDAEQLTKEMAIIAEIGRIISSTMDLEEVYAHFAKEVQKIIPFDRIVINSINVEMNTAATVYMAGQGIPDRQAAVSYPLKDTGSFEMVRTVSSLLIQTEDFNEYKDRFPGLLSTFEAGFRSIMNIPLFSKGEIIGGLLLRSFKPYAYTDHDVRQAERVGNQIAGAIANAQLFADLKKVEEEERRNREDAQRLAEENAIIAEIGRIISSTLDIEDVYEHFAEEVQKIIPFDRIVINSINVEMNTFINVYMAGQGIPDRQVGVSYPLKDTANSEMARTMSSLLIQMEDLDEYKDRFPGLLSTFQAGFRSIMNIPLLSKGRIIGGLLLRSFKPYAYTDHHVRLAERVGNQIAGAIANTQLFADLKKTEISLRESEELYESLLDQAGDGILILDTNGEIVSVNKSFARMHGFTLENMLHMKLDELDVVGEAASVPDRSRRIIRGETLSFEVEHYHKDGHIFPLAVTANLVSSGNKRLIIAIHRDLTESKQAEGELQQTLESLRKAVGTTIQVLATAVETRDPYTAGHQLRSADLARAIATEMKLPQEKIDAIRMAGSIHDIGKLSIPAEILSKPTKLSEIEFSLIKEHARRGFEMLKDVESPWPLAEIVYQHHERMDGSGYPRNLKGEDICIEARILAVADVVEAMASHRPYRPGLGIDLALNEIEKNRGLFYDKTVVDACLSLFREKGFQLAES